MSNNVTCQPVSRRYDAAVIIGRFQTPYLHSSHISLIDYVRDRHSRTFIFLGVGPVPCTHRNPLDFETRAAMIRKQYGDTVFCVPIIDQKSDVEWSRTVDAMVSGLVGTMSVCLYGGRDSFLPHYTGRYPTDELETSADKSATELRYEASRTLKESADFRIGVISGIYRQYTGPVMTVDVAPFRYINGEKYFLLGIKPNEDKLRFIGGFVDVGETLEEAAHRELREEASVYINPSNMRYYGSRIIDDWRYRNERRKILTSLFGCELAAGDIPKAGDDIAEVRLIPAAKMTPENFVKEHEELRQIALQGEVLRVS